MNRNANVKLRAENYERDCVSPVVPRHVPWDGSVVILFFVFWLTAQAICVHFASSLGVLLYGEEVQTVTQSTVEHPLSQLVRTGKDYSAVLWVAFLSGVLVAPVTEEFLFRLLFQGYLSKRIGYPFAIVASAAVFALIHGGGHPVQSVNRLFYTYCGLTVANGLVFLTGLIYLKTAVQATAADLGWNVWRLPWDFFLAGFIFICCAPMVYGVNTVLKFYCPSMNLEPVPLFLFALVLGTLYCWTKRITPCIFLHIFLNGFSLAMMFLMFLR